MVLGLGLGLTLLAATSTQSDVDRVDRRELRLIGEELVALVETRLKADAQVLRSRLFHGLLRCHPQGVADLRGAE